MQLAMWNAWPMVGSYVHGRSGVRGLGAEAALCQTKKIPVATIPANDVEVPFSITAMAE
ncbi:hypothetical protein [Bradyrhizobium elkanii]|uniref:hypothetical protein n=1 Tax=Bradyrhizobium elkanii TaxID=29448 RepID=UPI00383856B9